MLDTFYKALMNFFVSSDPKWDDSEYPGPFTTRSDNDDAIAHHVNFPIDEQEED